MALRGVSQYTASVSFLKGHSTKMNNTERLNNLIKRSSVNAGMLKKANELSAKKYGRPLTSISDAADKVSAETNKTSFQKAQELKDNSRALYSSTLDIMSGKGKTDEEFITAAKNFAKDYNSTVKSLDENKNSLASTTGARVTDHVSSYSGALEKAGFRLGDDKTLSVDEEKMKANIKDARELFGDTYSFGGKLAKKVSALDNVAQFTGTSVGIYNRAGQSL